MRVLVVATVAAVIASTASNAGGLVPGSETGIEAHEVAERNAIAEGAHLAPGTANHTTLQHTPQTFGYSTSSSVLSDHNLMPGSEYGIERAEEQSRTNVKVDKYHNQGPVATSPLGWNFIVPGSDYGLL
ncbi:hypothetical protein U0C82_17280 [Fulvimarina sp. 2208YS6-2-32]|uniref:Uncharacterized protein n=1 Tax=Fulvimarina uroteuthidis TaxID=3098149 RepID=A0ABU5I684_9HYPH|nr:hypothetical protein [Fulvimarina sp. 2208YS6-2-32]MDY8110894.1 hypothetical protein [Fulvimarina sp. 2208YS6-2-32]